MSRRASTSRAVVVPMTPLLVRSESGLADPVAELREAAVAAVRDLAADVDRIVALCPVGLVGAPSEYWWASGRPGTGPLSVQVARLLLELAGVEADTVEIVRRGDDDAAPGAPAADIGLLVLGDGSARRGQAAPGFIDERAFPFDDLMADALEGGDGDALARLDQDLAAQLMVTGRRTFADLGRLVPRPSEAELIFRDDPFGMTYFVASWR